MSSTQPLTLAASIAVSCSLSSPSSLSLGSPTQTDYSLSPWTCGSTSDFGGKEQVGNKDFETLIAKTSELSLIISSPLPTTSRSAQFPLSSTSMQSVVPPAITLPSSTPFSNSSSHSHICASASPSLSPTPSLSPSPIGIYCSITTSPLPIMTSWSSLSLSVPAPSPRMSSLGQVTVLTPVKRDSCAQATSLRTSSSSAELSKEATIEMPVLVVDDEKSNRDILAKCLQKFGVSKITLATSGEEALEKLLVFSYRVVFMDNRMGANRKRGLDTIIEYRGMTSESAKINQTALFYLWTTDPKEDFDSAVLQKHKIVFLKKPTSPLEIAKIIKSIPEKA